MKFGGTSVGSAQRMNEVLEIVNTQKSKQKIVVLSAMAGTTNALVDICTSLYSGHVDDANEKVSALQDRYEKVCAELFSDGEYLEQARGVVSREFDHIKESLHTGFGPRDEKKILAQGEILSTQLFELLCRSKGQNVALLPALDFMRLDEKDEPFLERTNSLLKPMLVMHTGTDILITQGYICRDHFEQVDNLKRGGSDYTATILGAVTAADEIQIWTDIDGVHNNDPRVVDNTAPLQQLSYREAAELAYFGAKILHPTCVLPAERMRVPLRLKCTMKPDAPGTLISSKRSDKPITAIAAKDGISSVKIYSHRMLMAYGFLKKAFQVFEDHKTPVDMITTSEVAVSLTIDHTERLDEIVENLSRFSEVEVEHDYSIICIVGNELFNNTDHVQKIFKALADIPVRMVSMGGSKYNVSILIKTDRKKDALIALNSIFE